MKLRVIPTKVHGRLDYITAPGMVAAPELLRLDGARGATLPPRLNGVAAAIYSALTDYEVGIRRVIPMRAHLALDAASGAALASSPWITGAARRGLRHWLPHALIGASEIAIAAITRPDPPRTTGLRRAWNAVPKPVAIGVGVGVAATAAVAIGARKRFWKGVAAVADVVEEAADAVEDAAEDLADAARERAGE